MSAPFGCTQDDITVNNHFQADTLGDGKTGLLALVKTAWSMGSHIPWPFPGEGPSPGEPAQWVVLHWELQPPAAPRLPGAWGACWLLGSSKLFSMRCITSPCCSSWYSPVSHQLVAFSPLQSGSSGKIIGFCQTHLCNLFQKLWF